MAVKRIDSGDEFVTEYRRCREWLLSALYHDGIVTTERSLLQGLEDRTFVLWTCDNSAFVTSIQQWDTELVCFVYLIGGDMDELMEEAEPQLAEWAAQQGCLSTAVEFQATAAE